MFKNSVTIVSLFIILVFTGFCFVNSSEMQFIFSKLQDMLASSLGWFYILASNYYLVFLAFILFSKFGKVKLGKEKPEYSLWGWFAMLFSAGMGIGLMFYSVAEPILHYAHPPINQDTDIANAKQAMAITFYHWGLHAWAIYALVGLALAYFAYSKKYKLDIRSIFRPLLGNKVDGPLGTSIDVCAIVATVFGLATSLGLGVKQINSGLAYLFHIPETTVIQLILIVITIALAITSVILGMDNGVKRLSEINMFIGLVLLVFILITGPTGFLMDSFVQNIGTYLSRFLKLATWTEAYKETNWQNSWTIFYLSWWIAWSPFVGMFIARISKGRSIKEFILGVTLVPTILTFFWINSFGGTALNFELFDIHPIANFVDDNIAKSLFALLNTLPFSEISSALAIIVLISFFVTSADSGAIVLDIIASGGRLDTPTYQRVVWALIVALIAITLLIFGGLQALQTASMLFALPFAVILLMMTFSLYKSLKESDL